MMDYNGSGMSVMEMSHRSKEYQEIIETAEQDRLKALVDENPSYFYDILPCIYCKV